MESPLERRERDWKRVASGRFDVIVIGGGITGAGIYRDAVLRGLKVALFEKEDFAYGTSSRSSKLVHGGLRYLELLNFGLVFESTHERARLMKLASHMVRPLPFLLPVYRGSRHSLLKVEAGMWLYDILASFRNYRLHRLLGPKGVTAREGLLRKDGLKGGVLYYDAATDDARLTLENILDGTSQGGIALNRCEVQGVEFRGGKVCAVNVIDRLSGAMTSVETNCIICAAGPWTKEVLERLHATETGPRLRPTKGTHIVLPRDLLPICHAVVMVSPIDGRVMFAIPWQGATLIGTTDTDFVGNPDEVYADRADAEYLLASVNHYFPTVKVQITDIVGTWAGLRPLIASDAYSPSEVSREHLVTSDPRGIVTIAGGKLTTYRLMAAEAVKAALKFIPEAPRKGDVTKHRPLPYGQGILGEGGLREAASQIEADFHLPTPVATRIASVYGSLSLSLLRSYREEDPSLLEPIRPGLPFLRFEALHAARSEFATTLEDFLLRRTPLFFLDKEQALPVAEEIADLMGSVLSWDSQRKEKEVKAIRALAERHTAFARP